MMPAVVTFAVMLDDDDPRIMPTAHLSVFCAFFHRRHHVRSVRVLVHFVGSGVARNERTRNEYAREQT